MSTIIIRDLERDHTLDAQAMRAVLGGSRSPAARQASVRSMLREPEESPLIPGLWRRRTLPDDEDPPSHA